MSQIKKWARRTALTLTALVTLAGGVLFVGNLRAEHQMHRQVNVSVRGVEYRNDSASLERGRYLYASRGCADCHGQDGAGVVACTARPAHLRPVGPRIAERPQVLARIEAERGHVPEAPRAAAALEIRADFSFELPSSRRSRYIFSFLIEAFGMSGSLPDNMVCCAGCPASRPSNRLRGFRESGRSGAGSPVLADQGAGRFLEHFLCGPWPS